MLRSLQPFRSAVAALAGMAAGLLLTGTQSLVLSTLLNALVLVLGARISSRCQQASRWWGLIGVASGALTGNGWVVARSFQASEPSAQMGVRLVTVLLLGCAGGLAAAGLERLPSPARHRRPRDLLRSASGLTTGLFATCVTLTFIHSGLDGARMLSSRLSTALTILVISLAAPGWLLQQWREHRASGWNHPSHRTHADGR